MSVQHLVHFHNSVKRNGKGEKVVKESPVIVATAKDQHLILFLILMAVRQTHCCMPRTSLGGVGNNQLTP